MWPFRCRMRRAHRCQGEHLSVVPREVPSAFEPMIEVKLVHESGCGRLTMSPQRPSAGALRDDRAGYRAPDVMSRTLRAWGSVTGAFSLKSKRIVTEAY